jgi:hypothetical protein
MSRKAEERKIKVYFDEKKKEKQAAAGMLKKPACLSLSLCHKVSLCYG